MINIFKELDTDWIHKERSGDPIKEVESYHPVIFNFYVIEEFKRVREFWTYMMREFQN